jgi:hypothetical protein
LASIGDGEQLLLEVLDGPIKAYFDSENFEKEALEEKIEEDLQRLRQEYRQTQKFMNQSF